LKGVPIDFFYPSTKRVVFGRGQVAASLPSVIAGLKGSRCLVITGNTIANSTPLVGVVAGALAGSAQVSVAPVAREHVPTSAVLDAVHAARSFGANVLIAVGGSSPLDTAKATALVLAADDNSEQMRERLEEGNFDVSWVAAPKIPIVSIPTTLSGSEFTAVVGITSTSLRVKHVLRHNTMTPSAVILDSDFTVYTPESLWASTGIKLLDHAVERTLAVNHNPLIDVQSVAGIKMIQQHLEASVPPGEDLAERREPLLLALWVIQFGHGNVGSGLSHALAHQLGGRCGVPHGYGSSLFLPPVLRFNRDAVLDRFPVLAEGLGVESRDSSHAAELVIDEISGLVRRMALPTTLSAVGVTYGDLEPLARAAMGDSTIKSNPRQPRDVQELTELLKAIL
jgi:alcohol dehydrogenase class IV